MPSANCSPKSPINSPAYLDNLHFKTTTIRLLPPKLQNTSSTTTTLTRANTMKQKVVIKVSMTGHKCQRKAMKIAVSISGVDSASLKGEDKNQIEVVGDGVDVIELTKLLRKNVGHAELVSVSPAKKEEEKKKEDPKVLVWPYVSGVPQYSQFYEVRDAHLYNDHSSCSIM